MVPGVAAVGRAIDATGLASRDQRPRLALGGPGARVENARVVGVHREIDDARAVVDKEDLFPCLAAIGGAENAPLFVGAEHMAERSDVDMIGVVRMDADLANLSRIAKADVLPRLPRIRRAVDAVTGGDIASGAGRSRPNVDDVRIRRSDRNRAHRAHAEKTIRHVGPVIAGVRRLENTASCAAKIVDERLSGNPRRRGRSSPAGKTHRSELHPFEKGVVHLDVLRVFFVIVITTLRCGERCARDERAKR